MRVNAVVDLSGRALVPAALLAWDIANWVEAALRYIASGTLPMEGSLAVGPSFEQPEGEAAEDGGVVGDAGAD